MRLKFQQPEDYYFSEGHTTQRNSIIISVILLLLILVVAVVTAGIIRKPLDRLGDRMHKTASLEDDDEDDKPSFIDEVARMQTAYSTMLKELKRIKSYLPQSVLAGIDDDGDDSDEESEANSSRKPQTKEGSATSRATRHTPPAAWTATPSVAQLGAAR